MKPATLSQRQRDAIYSTLHHTRPCCAACIIGNSSRRFRANERSRIAGEQRNGARRAVTRPTMYGPGCPGRAGGPLGELRGGAQYPHPRFRRCGVRVGRMFVPIAAGRARVRPLPRRPRPASIGDRRRPTAAARLGRRRRQRRGGAPPTQVLSSFLRLKRELSGAPAAPQALAAVRRPGRSARDDVWRPRVRPRRAWPAVDSRASISLFCSGVGGGCAPLGLPGPAGGRQGHVCSTGGGARRHSAHRRRGPRARRD